MKLISKRDKECLSCKHAEASITSCKSRKRGYCIAEGVSGLPGWEPKSKKRGPVEARCAEFNRKLPCSSCPEFDVDNHECLLEKPRVVPNKYKRVINGASVDVYDILKAYEVNNPALQHLIKKALCAGIRGHKDRKTDMKEILSAANRALELEEIGASDE